MQAEAMTEPTIAVLEERLVSMARTMAEHDRRYTEREEASGKALERARMAVEREAEKLQVALKEYKIESNEWRATVADLVAQLKLFGTSIAKMEVKIESLEISVQDYREYRSAESGESSAKSAAMVAARDKADASRSTRSMIVNIGIFAAGALLTVVMFVLSRWIE